MAFTVKEQLGDLDKTRFVGYDTLETKTTLSGMIVDGQKIAQAEDGQEVYAVLPVTPFYAMSGGQVGDQGMISGGAGRIVVDRTEKMPDGKYVHHGVVQGTIDMGETVLAQVDAAARQATARNHTATHLLHKALREVLGDHVHQAGSSVDGQRLRFDFSHMSAVTAAELAQVEAEIEAKRAEKKKKKQVKIKSESGETVMKEVSEAELPRSIEWFSWLLVLPASVHGFYFGLQYKLP